MPVASSHRRTGRVPREVEKNLRSFYGLNFIQRRFFRSGSSLCVPLSRDFFNIKILQYGQLHNQCLVGADCLRCGGFLARAAEHFFHLALGGFDYTRMNYGTFRNPLSYLLARASNPCVSTTHTASLWLRHKGENAEPYTLPRSA